MATHAHQPPILQSAKAKLPSARADWVTRPLRPKRAGGSGPFRNTFGELAALASSRRRAQNWGQTVQEGDAAASDGNPIPGDGKPAAPKPSQQSALWSTCRVCPTPAGASINGRGINDQGTYSGGVARPAAPTSGKGGCRGESHRRRNPHHPQSAMPGVEGSTAGSPSGRRRRCASLVWALLHARNGYAEAPGRALQGHTPT